MTGGLGGDHHDVHAGLRYYLFIVDAEAVGDHQGAAGLQVGFNLLAVDATLDVVGNDHHQNVCFFGNIGNVGHSQSGGFGNGPTWALRIKANDHVLSVVLQVEGVGMALAAVADHADCLAF